MSRRIIIVALCVALLWPGAAVAADAAAAAKHAAGAGDKDTGQEPAPQYNIVLLQGLNKVTGHISRLKAPVGTVMRFGNLEIVAHRCWKSAPEDRPENAALLEISELRPGEPPSRIFLGWMFSSSPGLSALEHPVYDITVLACEQTTTEPEKNDTDKKPSAKKAAKKK